MDDLVTEEIDDPEEILRRALCGDLPWQKGSNDDLLIRFDEAFAAFEELKTDLRNRIGGYETQKSTLINLQKGRKADAQQLDNLRNSIRDLTKQLKEKTESFASQLEEKTESFASQLEEKTEANAYLATREEASRNRHAELTRLLDESRRECDRKLNSRDLDVRVIRDLLSKEQRTNRLWRFSAFVVFITSFVLWVFRTFSL